MASIWRPSLFVDACRLVSCAKSCWTRRREQVKGLNAHSPAEAALPVPISAQRAQEVDLAKVRPVDLGEIELAVGALPEQEARQSQLAAGADDEVRIRELRDVEMAGDGFRGNHRTPSLRDRKSTRLNSSH